MKMGVLLALIQSHVKLCRPSQLPSVLVLSNGTSNGKCIGVLFAVV